MCIVRGNTIGHQAALLKGKIPWLDSTIAIRSKSSICRWILNVWELTYFCFSMNNFLKSFRDHAQDGQKVIRYARYVGLGQL